RRGPRPRTRRRARAARAAVRPRPQPHRQGPPPQDQHAMTSEINPNYAEAAPPKSGKRKRALLIVALVVIAALCIWLLWYLVSGRWHECTDDAYVQGNVVSITPQAGGTVVAINAEDGMKVVAGQVLVQLAPHDPHVAFEPARANLAGTVRQVRGLFSSV